MFRPQGPGMHPVSCFRKAVGLQTRVGRPGHGLVGKDDPHASRPQGIASHSEEQARSQALRVTVHSKE